MRKRYYQFGIKPFQKVFTFQHLADDLVIEFMGKDSSSQTKEEHIAWCVSDESPRIGGFKVIFEENGVAVGTHTAFNPQGEG